MKVYVYMVIREDWETGERAKRPRSYWSYTDKLEVGGLYAQLGKGFPGFQRVLSRSVEEIPD